MSEYIVGIDFGASSIKAVINNGDKLLSLKLSKNGETCELPNVIWYNKMSSGKISANSLCRIGRRKLSA